MNEPRTPITRALLATAAIGVSLLIVGLMLLTLRFDLSTIRSIAMTPTLAQGDRVAIAPPGEVRRGDIVRFRSSWPEMAGAAGITFRVTAIGGDRVRSDAAGALVVNGRIGGGPDPSRITHEPFELVVPTGRVFLTGDASDLANDSRLHRTISNGTVATSAITGRVVGIAWPPQHWGRPGTSAGYRVRSLAIPIGGRDVSYRLGSLLTVLGVGTMVVPAIRLVGSLLRRRRPPGG